MADSLQGESNGYNQTFTVSYEYNPGYIEIIYNGQVLTSPTDFEETGPQEITFVYLKPIDITVLKANYVIGDCGEATPSTFLELGDTPSNYGTNSGKIVSVNENENGLSFIDFERKTKMVAKLRSANTTRIIAKRNQSSPFSILICA